MWSVLRSTLNRRRPKTVNTERYDYAADFLYRQQVLDAVWKLIPDGITTDDDFAWHVTEEVHVGSWLWEHHDGDEWSDTWIYASPWWEGADRVVAISLCVTDHDDGLLSLDIPIRQPSGDVKRDATEYIRVMRKFLNHVSP